MEYLFSLYISLRYLLRELQKCESSSKKANFNFFQPKSTGIDYKVQYFCDDMSNVKGSEKYEKSCSLW